MYTNGTPPTRSVQPEITADTNMYHNDTLMVNNRTLSVHLPTGSIPFTKTFSTLSTGDLK